jgi:integrase
MASLRRLPNSPYWIACFTLPDGTRTQRSTRSNDRREAQRIANKYEDAAKAAKAGRLCERQARKVIADIFSIANKEQLPSTTIKAFFEAWLKRKELETGEKTHIRYSVVVEQFLEFLGNKASLDIGHVTAKEITRFRDTLIERSSPNTVNVSLKIIRAAFNQARRDGLIDQNEAERVTLMKRVGPSNRRPFTLDEIRRVLEVADKEWKGMILTGLYTGLRLGDIASLTWANLDLTSQELRLVTQKTGRIQNIPLAQPLIRQFESLPATEDPHQPLFPRAFNRYATNYFNGDLSKQFYQILVSAGLAQPRAFRVTGKGHKVRHQQHELSFHCLRHTATSLLKNAGVSDVIARDIIGHDSAAVSRQYTHIDQETKRKAVNMIPDIGNGLIC